MSPEKLTSRSREALLAATQLAQDHHHASILPEHLALGLLGQQEGIVHPLLDGLGVTPLEIRRSLEGLLDRQPHVYGDAEIAAGPELGQILTNADRHRASMGDDYLSVEHLLLGLSDSEGSTGSLLRESGLTPAAILEALQKIRGGRRVTSEDPEAPLNALQQYGRDLTAVAVFILTTNPP
ncbi:MAG: Clp protease N-terminal domain-containing protein [Acidimicrobiia bacterium]